ncbi:MAG TPA: hypothetical protein VFE13_05400 [Caulobacteraceae bacterium]|nr:hypothetical protein [Caulobacteraceae bacterium]
MARQEVARTFEAVQRSLANAARRRDQRPKRKDSMLLTGLIFDADGHPMSPTIAYGRKPALVTLMGANPLKRREIDSAQAPKSAYSRRCSPAGRETQPDFARRSRARLNGPETHPAQPIPAVAQLGFAGKSGRVVSRLQRPAAGRRNVALTRWR